MKPNKMDIVSVDKFDNLFWEFNELFLAVAFATCHLTLDTPHAHTNILHN